MSSKKAILLGFILGIVTSFILSIIIFYSSNPGVENGEFLSIYVKSKLIVPVVSISLLANMALFFIFIRLNKDNISKGLLIATMLIGLGVLIIRLV
ncbi:MAG: hypothetical protein V4613_11590 [Bacteroidota bacterium]